MKIKTTLVLVFATCVAAQLAKAQFDWTGGDVPNGSLIWSDVNNWSGGAAPGSSSAVLFPDGAFPVSTNAQGLINNIVQVNTTIASLAYDNLPSAAHYETTEIPSGTVLTITGGLTIGVNNSADTNTVVTMTGGGTLIGGTSGSQTLTVQNGGSSSYPASILDLSGLANFIWNYGGSGGSMNLGNGGSGDADTVNLAAGSNSITVGTLYIGYNNTRGSSTLNLGNGTNNIYADTINMGFSKTTGTMQFDNNAGGGLAIASHTGTGRANINLGGEQNTGATTSQSTGNMLLDDGTVNILAGTITLGNRYTRGDSPGANGNLYFNKGVVDATFINMATNQSGGGSGNARIAVGNSGLLRIGTGGMSMCNEAGTGGTSTLIITNGASVTCAGSIYKGTPTGSATITMSGATLALTDGSSTIGVANSIAIDNFDVTNSILTLSAIGVGLPDVVVANFNPDTATTNTINIGFLPAITNSMMQFPLIQYTAPAGGNLPNEIGVLTNFALGTLPGGVHGYLSNNLANSSIDLVVTNALVAKADEWIGNVNDLWDTTTLNWKNNGLAVNYNDLDFVTFDDNATATAVNLTAAREPGTLTFANSVLSFTLTGTGEITGPVQLLMTGTATNTLAESGGDNFSGGIQINSGEIILDDANCAISGGLTISSGVAQIGNNDVNGALPGGAVADNGTLIFERANNLTVSTAISGTGSLTQNGTATLTINAAQGYSGGTEVNAGTLALTGGGSIASSSAVNVGNATLSVSGVTGNAGITTLQALDMANAVLDVKAGYMQTNLIITGALNWSGPTNTLNVESLPAIADYPATITLINAAGGIVGFNFLGLGTLPTATPAYAGTLSQVGNNIVLTLSAGPIGSRPSVTWSGADAMNTGNTNWSDALNWQTPGVPTASEPVFFTDTDVAGGPAFSAVGDGAGGIVSPLEINNYVDVSLTNSALSYGNSSGFHNTRIAPGKTLTINGSLTVNGSGGSDAMLGASGQVQITDPNNNNTLNVGSAGISTLDMSGLDTFDADVNQITIGYGGSAVYGQWYLAKTNIITTGSGFSGGSAAWVIGGSSSQSSAGNAQVYLGQTNAIYVDGIVLGPGPSVGNVLKFNPNIVANNPSVYIRGVSGPASRVTLWSLGDATVTLNANIPGYNQVVDFTAGTVNALVDTLNVGMGYHSNIALSGATTGTFSMGAGNLDVTTLNIGVSANGQTGGAGVGVMNVTGGTVTAADALGLGVGNVTASSGTLDLTNAILVDDNGVTTAAGTTSILTETNSTLEFGNGTIGSAGMPITTISLSGGTLQFNVNGVSITTNITATTVTTNGPVTTIHISSLTSVATGTIYPLVSYTGTDPYGNFSLALPVGYAGTLLDDSNSDLVELELSAVPVGRPVITGISISGRTLTINAINGEDNSPYVLYETTNLAPPIVWTPVFTNSFSGTGTINLSTNVVSPTTADEFYEIGEP